MSRLLGLLLLGLLTAALIFSASSCETSRTREAADPTREAQGMGTNRTGELTNSSRQIMQLNEEGKVEYKLSPSVMEAALIRQFHDGTVIDRVLVHKAPTDANSKEKPVYYLVGMGNHDGSFRAVAMPLRGADDGTFYLTPNADRYVISGIGCPSCYFDFEDGFITGTTCDDNSGGSSCTLKVLTGNEVFAAAPSAKTPAKK